MENYLKSLAEIAPKPTGNKQVQNQTPLPYEKKIAFDDGHGFTKQDFYRLVKSLTLEREKYPKGTYYNLVYKFLANAGIGQFGRGLSRKTQYSPKLDSTVVVGGGPLSNPLLGG